MWCFFCATLRTIASITGAEGCSAGASGLPFNFSDEYPIPLSTACDEVADAGYKGSAEVASAGTGKVRRPVQSEFPHLVPADVGAPRSQRERLHGWAGGATLQTLRRIPLPWRTSKRRICAGKVRGVSRGRICWDREGQAPCPVGVPPLRNRRQALRGVPNVR